MAIDKLKKVKNLIDKTKELGSVSLAKEFISMDEKLNDLKSSLENLPDRTDEEILIELKII